MTSVTVAISETKDGTMYVPTDHEDVATIEHRLRWLNKHGIRMDDAVRLFVTYDREDFCKYIVVDESNKHEGMEDGGVEAADALVTTTPGVALFLPVADCVAATFYAEKQGVLMLAHLGRHSLEQQGAVRSVKYLEEMFGVNPSELKVWLSPAPGKDTYQIFKLDNQGMKEATYHQLEIAGVSRENIIDNPADTATDDRYFSHSEFLKGNKPTDGRYAMVAMMQN